MIRKKFIFLSFILFHHFLYSQIGALDSTFGTNGISIPNSGLFDGRITGTSSLLIQPDNKILITGSAYNSDPTYDDIATIRTLPNGLPDMDFNSTGYRTTDIGNVSNRGRALALQSDGKIVCVAMTENAFSLIRYNPDGTLDDGFGVNGIVNTDIIGNIYECDDVYSVAVLNDNKILVAGSSGNGDKSNIFLVKYNSNGTLDNTFGNNGVVITAISDNYDVQRSMVIQNDNKILISGYTEALDGLNSDFFVMRYTVDGKLDTTFNHVGYTITDMPEYIMQWCYSMALQKDNKILLTGAAYFCSGIIDNVLIRYNPDGTLDSLFGDNGIVTSNLSNIECWSTDLTIQENDKIIVNGYCRVGFDQNIAVYRYNYDGTIDTSFGKSGVSLIDLGSYQDNSLSSSLQGNKLIVAGSKYEDKFVLLRFNLDSLDYFDSTEINYESNKLIIYPNPASQHYIDIRFYLPVANKININLYNLNGILVNNLKSNILLNKGYNKLGVNIPSTIFPGLYLIAVENMNFKRISKIIIL